ncbi:Protein of unknown function [Luteibacter sp. UNCMF331Sha3.1]|nr:Protein of unknown function [Luteibacter sp. UNCMF331Sha3.1]
MAVDVAAPLYGRDVVAEGRRLGLRPTYKGCLDASGGVIPDMRDCISEEMGYQDERLNRVYKQVMAKLDPTAKRALRDEERAWILQRDIDCDPGPEPGQGMELDAYGCAVRSTASRARELEQMLQK